jgi:hypothetical protein
MRALGGITVVMSVTLFPAINETVSSLNVTPVTGTVKFSLDLWQDINAMHTIADNIITLTILLFFIAVLH